MDRIEAFRALCKRYYLDLDGNYSGQEDAQAVLDGLEPIDGPWVAVTSTGGGETFVYAYVGFSNPFEAMDKALESITDDLYSEVPVAIVNLDDGTTREPDWSTLQWK